MKTKYCRKFGKTIVTFDTISGRISVIDEYTSNYGIIYHHMINKFKDYCISGKPTNVCNCPQVIGMDKEISGMVLDYIYSIILSGKCDNLQNNYL